MIAEDAEVTVTATRQRTPVAAELLRPAGPPLGYQRGQCVLAGDPEAELAARSYSIANAPHRDGVISLLVTRYPAASSPPRCTTWSGPATECCYPAPAWRFPSPKS